MGSRLMLRIREVAYRSGSDDGGLVGQATRTHLQSDFSQRKPSLYLDDETGWRRTSNEGTSGQEDSRAATDSIQLQRMDAEKIDN